MQQETEIAGLFAQSPVPASVPWAEGGRGGVVVSPPLSP